MLQVYYNGSSPLLSPGSERPPFFSRDSYTGSRRADMMSREEHRARELSRMRLDTRSPRRSHTHHDYQLPSATPSPSPATPHALRLFPIDKPTIRVATEDASPEKETISTPQDESRPRRPPLGPPRRSHSVIDYEPAPHYHRAAGDGLTLLDLPSELHYAIFDFLDPIDSTCLGLANRKLYRIHRRLHGIVPLSARRNGPNELEWAWHVAGNPLPQAMLPVPSTPTVTVSNPAAVLDYQNALAKLRIRGQAYCRKCGVCRCELHKHIQDWIRADGPEIEYCSIRQRFGPPAPEGAKDFCYMSTPKDPRRCGRHRIMKAKVVLQ
jgi:hypothetical protein